MMKDINKENFKEAIAFLEANKEHIQANLAMNTFGSWTPDSSGNVCNSPACIIGHVISGQSVENLEEHTDYLLNSNNEKAFSVSYSQWSYDFFFNGYDADYEDVENMWHFLFFDKWPNDIEQAILRMKYVLHNEDVLKGWDYGNYRDGIYLYVVEE